ncbi:EF-P 5-aminopentanol modification-associated protein YfmF [Marininema halotolerans]|uniref:Predicted Zn-dependent peptidase n=1 Tax=Marininema halotolerans TaxID=1155944 RepID=A0A1I6R5S0_9BACL|nr:pitrilysin family protein [Marininema halotolerans]SFS60035.1 Predicted Zn-dependent peptidase [Marininema halotolerans]
MSSVQFETVQMGNLRVHICSTEKFKTNMISALVQQSLSPETVTRHALLPAVLQRGTRSYPTTLQLKRKLDDLYGATLFGDVYKRGERHIMQLGMEIPNETYLTEAESLLDQGAAFLGEILMAPATEGNAFKETYVKAEKKNLKQKIESLMDDKIRYAAQRCVSEMCSDEPFSLFNHGRMQDLDSITAQDLYTYYQELIQTRPLDLYFVGNLSVDRVCTLVDQFFPTEGRQRNPISTPDVHHAVRDVKEVVDRLDVKQGKLNMGARTQIALQDDDYIPLLMYNGILGGYPHSKLFINVREKSSLAYYAASRLESHKGILTVQSGIEIENYQQAVDIIREQFDLMRSGNITDSEISQTKAMLVNQLRERQDRSHDLIDSHYHSVLSGVDRPLNELIEGVQQVSKDDVVRVAEKVQIDTIYFLRDKKGGAQGGAH